MGLYNKAIPTNQGLALIASAIASGTDVVFTSVQTSSYQYPAETDFTNLTALQDVVQTVVPSSVGVFNNTVIRVSATFTNTDVESKYQIQTIGIFAQAGSTGSPILFATSTAQTPDEVPAETDTAAPSSFIYNINMVVNQASQVTVTVAPGGTASPEDIQALKTEIETIQHVTLPASGWSGAAPYTNTVTVPNLSADETPIPFLDPRTASSNTVLQNMIKNFAYLSYYTSGAGTLTATAMFTKPTIDLPIALKGV